MIDLFVLWALQIPITIVQLVQIEFLVPNRWPPVNKGA
jgi:hypothetical protein